MKSNHRSNFSNAQNEAIEFCYGQLLLASMVVIGFFFLGMAIVEMIA